MLLRFPQEQLGLGRPSNTVYTDPRDGSPATEYVRFIEAQQLLWEMLPTVLNLYTPSQTINAVACENLCKFGINYVVKAGPSYQWFHPTYVWDIARDLMQPVQFMATPIALAPAAGTGDAAGQLNTLPHEPMTEEQSSALDAHAVAHDAQAQAVLAGDLATAAALAPAVVQTLDAFVATARNLAEQQLFDLIFTGEISADLDQAELVDQTEGLMVDHMAWHRALMNGGEPPDVPLVQLAGFSHNMRHAGRAFNAHARKQWRGRHYLTTYQYATVTTAELAAIPGGGFRP